MLNPSECKQPCFNRTNKAKKVVLSALALPLMFAASSAFAKGDSDAPEYNKASLMNEKKAMCHFMSPANAMAGINPRMIKALKLTTEQKAQLKAIRKAGRQAAKAERIEQAKRVKHLLYADQFDKSAALALAKKMDQQRIAVRVAKLENQFKMLHVLTPEQKDTLMALQKAHRQDCAKWAQLYKNKRHTESQPRD